MQFFFLVFLSFWIVCAYPKLKQQQKIRFRERLSLFVQKKEAPALGKSVTDFGKSVTDFEEIRH